MGGAGLSGVVAAEGALPGGNRGGQARKTPPCITRPHTPHRSRPPRPLLGQPGHPWAGASREAHTGRALNKKRESGLKDMGVCRGLRGDTGHRRGPDALWVLALLSHLRGL